MRTRLQKFACVAAGATVLAAAAGCGRAPSPPLPSGGTTRVVSLAPSVTEIVCALGGGPQLVGRTTVCDYPPTEIAGVPVIGGFGDPSLERLLAVRPDMVLYADIADAAIASRLSRAGLRHARIVCNRLDDIPPAIRDVGRWIGRDSHAESLAADLAGRIREAREQAPPADRQPRVLMLIWNDPLTAVGRNSFVADLLALAGGRNVGDRIDRDYFQASSEWVLAENPDIILCFYMTAGTSPRQGLLQQSGWSGVKAIREGRVYDAFDNSLVLRPGPRVMEGMASLRRCLNRPDGEQERTR